MTQGLVAGVTPIWEECIDKEVCIKVIFKKFCLKIHACIRVIDDGGSYFIEIDIMGKRFKFKISDACYDLYTVVIGSVKICISAITEGGNLKGVKFALEACLGVDGVKKCFTIFSKDIRFFKLADLNNEEAMAMGLHDEGVERFALAADVDHYGFIESDLTIEEERELLGMGTRR